MTLQISAILDWVPKLENHSSKLLDDNSEDGTIDVVKEYQKKNDLVKLFVRKDERRSLPESINLGIKNSSYENLIWMDADYQHPPRYILDLTKNSTNYDLVICSRFLKESERYFNREELKKELNENQSFVFNKLCNFFLFKDITDFTSGFICIKKKVFLNYELDGYYGDYFVDLILHSKKNNFSILEIPFTDELRASGHSKTLKKLTFSYLYTCLRYLLTLAKCFFNKMFYKFRR